MKNYWRQFTGSAIDSRDKTIFRTRKGLTLVFLLSVFVILLVSHLFRSYTILSTSRLPAVNTPSQVLVLTWQDLARSGIVENLAMAFLIVVAAWFIIGLLLKPIKEIQESQKLFMADAAHELFTPLSIMKTNTEVALMDGPALSSQVATETLHGVLEEVDRMSSIIKNLMRLSSKTQMPFAKVNLSAVAEKAIGLLSQLAIEKNINIGLVKDDSAVMWGSETALEEMIINLVKNSIQYSPVGGTVKVSVKDNTPTDILLRVQDRGIGISNKDLKRIFEPFYRVNNHDAQFGRKGSGLGLSIVQEIVKLHNGSIKARSTPGKGTVIDVRFSLLT